MAEQKIFKELNKTLKYRARRSKVLPANFEDPEGSGEVAVSVADDRELDALQQKHGQDSHTIYAPPQTPYNCAAPSARRSS